MRTSLQRGVISFYLLSARSLDRLVGLIRASFNGVWLGLFSRELLHQIDGHYYDTTSNYHDESYNRRGLWMWEREMLRRYFSDCETLLVAAVGGGRETLGLHRLGYRVDSFECNPTLVARANRLLEEDGVQGRVQLTVRDSCPPGTGIYDGLIVGWGAYMLIQGRARRVAFLRELRARVRSGGPIMLSFFTRPGDLLSFRITAGVANLFRALMRRERAELGDSLAPVYAHHFTRAEIAGELRDAGFELVFYSTQDYGHAVAEAVPRRADAPAVVDSGTGADVLRRGVASAS